MRRFFLESGRNRDTYAPVCGFSTAGCAVQSGGGRGRRTPRVVSLVCVVVVGLPSLSPLAHACSGAICFPGLTAPAPGRSVPANVAALPVRPEKNYWDAGTAPDIELLDADKAIVPTHRMMTAGEDLLLVPMSPLSPGPHYFHRRVTCHTNTAVIEDVPFTVTTATPVPLLAGTVSVSGPRLEPALLVSTSAGSCTVTLPALVVDVTFNASAELMPFLSVALISLIIDGREWAAPFWGDQMPFPRDGSAAPRINLSPFTACGGTTRDDKGLPEGSHTGELIVRLPNASAPLPGLPFSFTTSCSAWATDAEAPDGATRDGGNSDVSGPPCFKSSNRSGGCTLSPESTATSQRGSLVGFILVAALFLNAWMRRRIRRMLVSERR